MIVIDRIATDLAICIDEGTVVDIPLINIDECIKEGDVLSWDETKSKYIVDAQGTEARFLKISEQFSRIKKRNRSSI